MRAGLPRERCSGKRADVTRAACAGTGKPESAINESKPAVFNTTVLPPAFAPEITITG